MQSARAATTAAEAENQDARRIQRASFRQNFQRLRRKRHTMPSALFRPARRHGPKPIVQIELRPLSLGDLAQATRRQNDEPQRQLEHPRHIRRIQGTESGRNPGVRQTDTVSGRRIDLRQPEEDLLSRIVEPVLLSDGPRKNVKELMPNLVSDTTAATPQRTEQRQTVVDGYSVDRLRTQHGQDIAGETRTITRRGIRRSPRMLTVLDDRLETLLQGRYHTGRPPTGVLALPQTTTVLRRELAGLREQHIGVAAENKIATATVNREAHDKGFRGWTDAEMETSAVAVTTRAGLTAHPISETEEPTDALDACPHAGDTGSQMGHWTPSTRRRGGPILRAP